MSGNDNLTKINTILDTDNKRCRLCGQIIKYMDNTDNLWEHLMNNHWDQLFANMYIGLINIRDVKDNADKR